MSIRLQFLSAGRPPVALALVALCIVGLLGCGGDGDSREPPIGPDLQGTWAGVYRQTGGGNAMVTALTATIIHDGDAIIIRTSLTGLGARFTGTITEDGELTLLDAFDGEIWTTYYKKATTDDVEIADFLTPPQAGEDLPPLQVISLVR